MIFHLRFYYYVVKNFYVFPRRKLKTIFEPTKMVTFTSLLEMDFNMHKSNSTYFTDMDISRTDLLTKNLYKFYRNYEDPSLPKLKWYQFIYSPLGSVGVTFKRELIAYRPYTVESRILGWTSKWLFVITVFKTGKTINAYGIAKYVFKQQRKTIPPEQIIAFEGLLTEEAKKQNELTQKYLSDSLELEDIIKLVG